MPKAGWRWLAGLILVVLFVPAAWANLGPPSYGGQVTAEPIGIEAIEITRETLTLDLRPIAQKKLAQVEAIYRLLNEGNKKKLDLRFALGTLGTDNFQVWLDNQPITSEISPNAVLPSSWQAPAYTPGLNGKSLDYLRHSSEVKPMALTVNIPSGKHDLRVEYAAQTATHLSGKPTIYHQFAYILAPAKAWSAFGGLDVTIYLPRNWQVAITPALNRKGDVLQGAFTDLPGDAIALTMQAPEGWAYRPLKYGSQLLLGLIGLGGLRWGWQLGRTRGQHLSSSPLRKIHQQVWPWSIGFGLLWGIAILAVGWLAIYSPNWVLPAGQVSRYGYGQGFAILGIMGLSLLAVVIGFAVVQITSARHRQAKGSN